MKKLLYVVVVCILCVSCKDKNKDKDFRDAWCGYYDLTISEYRGAGPQGGFTLTSYPPGRLYYDDSMEEDELTLLINETISKEIVFKLVDKTGAFVETKTDEGNYEKGYVNSNGVLFYEKKISLPMNYNTYTIEGKYNETPF